jgi:hypothetical protein
MRPRLVRGYRPLYHHDLKAGLGFGQIVGYPEKHDGKGFLIPGLQHPFLGAAPGLGQKAFDLPRGSSS